MKMYKYKDFLNESKFDELKVGDKVIFTANSLEFCINFENYYTMKITGLKGKIGKIDDIRKVNEKYYFGNNMFFIDIYLEDMTGVEIPKSHQLTKYSNNIHKEFVKNFKEKNKITINSTNTRYLIKVEEETLKKIERGSLRKLEISRELKYIFKEIEFKPDGELFDITELDIDKDNKDNITFIPSNKYNKEDNDKYRQSSRSGRIFRKLNSKLKDSEIEELVNKFKSIRDVEFTVQVVTGDDIVYWYIGRRYKSGNGTLNKSCMRDDFSKDRIKFYANYPDKIALAVVIKDHKLWGRALIWRLDDGRVYMDRIYSVNAAISERIDKYAIDNNMLSRRRIKKIKEPKKIKVTLYNSDIKIYHNMPYLDSFSYDNISKNTHILRLNYF